jgi:hypothetical protein
MDSDDHDNARLTYDQAHEQVWKDLEHDINEFRAAAMDAISDMKFLLALRSAQFGRDPLDSAQRIRNALGESLENYAQTEADSRANGWGSRTERLLERSVRAARGIKPMERES